MPNPKVMRSLGVAVLRLEKLYDLAKLQDLLNQFSLVTDISSAVIDTQGKILVSSIRPKLCEQFFDSDRLPDVESCRLNRALLLEHDCTAGNATQICPHGLLDAAEPIMVQGECLGALLIGQVFADPPDLSRYAAEAEQCGFALGAFKEALSTVPVVSLERFEQARLLMSQLAGMLVDQGVARLKAEQHALVTQLHAESAIKDARRQKSQLKLYTMDQMNCNQLLDCALDEALACCDSMFGYLFLYDEDTRLLTLYSCFGMVPQACVALTRQTVIELDKAGILGEPVRRRAPVISNDPFVFATTAEQPQQTSVHFERHMSLPIVRDGKIIAIVGMANRQERYSETDGRHLQLLMDGAWNMLERRKALDELQAAKEFAEAASRLKSELLANVSHELRTPLNGIIGCTQLLRFTELSGEQDEYLAMIEESSNTELTLVNNLLELVKLEADGCAPEKIPFSLEGCVADVLQAYEVLARSKGLQVYRVFDPDMPVVVMADRVRIKQILLTLLGNAVKFTEKGAITVHAGCRWGAGGALSLTLAVADTGIGIAPEQMQRLFQPFTQLDMSATRKFGGLGLGLSICKRLTELLGGRIWVESKPDKGSKFSFEIPVSLPSPHMLREADKARLFVLLAEDDHISALSAATLLRKMGHDVIVAENGKDAMALWQRHPVDLVLMDINMPLMNGLEALHEIRRLELASAKTPTPIIAQTAYACYSHDNTFPRTDFDALITKPFVLEELETVLNLYYRHGASA